MVSGEQLHARAVVAINAGRFAAARSLLTRAAAAPIDAPTRGAVEASLAYLEAEAGNRAEARRLCDVALAREGLDARTRGSIHSQRATLLMLEGRSVEAMAELDAAIAMLSGSPVFLGRAHGNRGNLHLQRHDLGAAERDFSAAVRLLAAAGLPEEAAMEEHNLGYTRLLAGDLVGALREMDRARAVLAPLSPVVRATCDQDRAEVLMAAGLLAEGRASLEATARAYGSRRLARRRAETELGLAQALLLSDPTGAARVARLAGRRFASSGAPAMRVRADAVAFAADVHRGLRAPRLLTGSTRIAADLRAQGLGEQAVVVDLERARLLVARGETAPAARSLAAVRAGRGTALSTRLLEREVRAELAAATGRRPAALGHLRAGLDELHAWQSSFGSLDLQTGVAGHGVRLAALGLRLAVASRRSEVLLEWSERARMLASRVQPVRAPEDDQIAADLGELRALVGDGARRDPRREAALRRDVRERAWRHAGSGAVAEPVTLADLAASLGDDTALAAYVVVAGEVVALVVTSSGASWVELGDRAPLDALLGGLLPDLDVAASELPGAVAGFVRGRLAERLAALADLLVAPVLAAVGDRGVVLTPSGVLAGVPWTLLPGFTGRPVTVAQSATSWLARRTPALRTSRAGFVAGPRVPRAEEEVRAAAGAWPAPRLLCGADATAAAVSDLAASTDVLHVAAHGRHSAENPLFSGLQLADGPWFGYDVDQLRAVPDVVLLSACEVGRSTVRGGEELIGMTTAWLHAGARCVIASPAAVSDEAACDVLVALHRQLAGGADPSVAVAAAVPGASATSAPVPLVCFR